MSGPVVTWGTERTVDALYAWLTDVRSGINVELADVRARLTLTTDDLPNVAQFESWRYQGPRAQSYPYLAIVPGKLNWEGDPRDKTRRTVFQFVLVVLEGNIVGADGAGVRKAAYRYLDALEAMLTRDRRQPGGMADAGVGHEGWSLAGYDDGRILGVELDVSHGDGDVPFPDPDVNGSNQVVIRRFTVLTNEA